MKIYNPYERFDIINFPMKVNLFVTLPIVVLLMAFFTMYVFSDMVIFMKVILSVLATYIFFLTYQSCVSFACLQYVKKVKKSKDEFEIDHLEKVARPVTDTFISVLRLADTDDPEFRSVLVDITYIVKVTENHRLASKAWCEAMREIGIIKNFNNFIHNLRQNTAKFWV